MLWEGYWNLRHEQLLQMLNVSFQSRSVMFDYLWRRASECSHRVSLVLAKASRNSTTLFVMSTMSRLASAYDFRPLASKKLENNLQKLSPSAAGDVRQPWEGQAYSPKRTPRHETLCSA
jgi:hypothetical protein